MSVVGVLNWRRIIDLHLPILLLDIVGIEIAWLLANYLRLGVFTYVLSSNLSIIITGTWLFPMAMLPVMIVGGYRHPLRYFSFGDAMRLIFVVDAGWLIAYLGLLGVFHRNASISVAAIGLFIVVPAIIFPRIVQRDRWQRRTRESREPNTRVIIYGVGRRGLALASLLKQGFPGARVFGFLDDDRSLWGRYLLGVKVFGSQRT